MDTKSQPEKVKPVQSKSWPYSRPPTIDDLRVKLCWICREEELKSEPSPRKWVHPCACTLVAHESCLLTWIGQAKSEPSRASTALQCPQCATRYQIQSSRPLALKVMQLIHVQISRWSRYATIVVASSGLIFCSAIYGAHALRCFAGPDVATLLLGDSIRDWPWHAYVDLPFIPLSLILSRTSLMDSFLPLLPCIVFTPSVAFMEPSNSDLISQLQFSYPPSPALTLMVFPVVRAIYREAYRRVSKLIFPAKSGSTSTPTPTPAAVEQNEGDQRPPGDQAAVADQQQGEGGNVDVHDHTIRLSATSLSRLFIGSLILPMASAVSGDILKRLAKFSPLLRAFLGMNSYRRFGKASVGALGLMSSFEDLDPVWWRNCVGLSLFILVKDSVNLLHRWLDQRERKSRKVFSRAFEGVDLSGLDLIT